MCLLDVGHAEQCIVLNWYAPHTCTINTKTIAHTPWLCNGLCLSCLVSYQHLRPQSPQKQRKGGSLVLYCWVCAIFTELTYALSLPLEHRSLVSIDRLHLPSAVPETCRPMTTFLFADFSSNYFWVIIFLCGLVVSTAVLLGDVVIISSQHVSTLTPLWFFVALTWSVCQVPSQLFIGYSLLPV